MEASEQLLLDKLLAAIAEYKASDLHLVAGNFPILRVNSKLMPLSSEQPINIKFLDNIVESWLSDQQKKNLVQEREIVFAYTTPNKMRFRVGVYYQKGALAISLKLIPELIKSLEELGVPQAVQQIVDLHKGLAIIAGPFGSGKTSTIASLIETINQRSSKHIVTLEKPIEHLFADSQSVIEQREIGLDVPTVLEALKFIADEDVDIVVISSLEGKEIIEEVFKIVDYGRLVIAAVNAESVAQVLENIVHNFPPEEQAFAQNKLANIVAGICVQKIIPNLQGSAILACELFFPEENKEARAIIESGEFIKINNILDTAQRPNLVSFDRFLADLVNNSQVSLATALENAHDKEYFRSLAATRA